MLQPGQHLALAEEAPDPVAGGETALADQLEGDPLVDCRPARRGRPRPCHRRELAKHPVGTDPLAHGEGALDAAVKRREEIVGAGVVEEAEQRLTCSRTSGWPRQASSRYAARRSEPAPGRRRRARGCSGGRPAHIGRRLGTGPTRTSGPVLPFGAGQEASSISRRRYALAKLQRRRTVATESWRACAASSSERPAK